MKPIAAARSSGLFLATIYNQSQLARPHRSGSLRWSAPALCWPVGLLTDVATPLHALP